jgi:hypothetical protein
VSDFEIAKALAEQENTYDQWAEYETDNMVADAQIHIATSLSGGMVPLEGADYPTQSEGKQANQQIYT